MGQDGVAALRRNGWPESIGISGRFRSESVAGFVRNTQCHPISSDQRYHKLAIRTHPTPNPGV